MKPRKTFVLLLALGLPCAVAAPADEKTDAPAPGVLVVVDANGKEQKIKKWTFLAGTRRLGWLAPVEPEKEPGDNPAPAKAAPRGPEALVFRDENSTAWKEGVLTLIPLKHLRRIDYDSEQKSVTVHVAAGKEDKDATLTGSTRFRESNKLVIEAEVDKGDLGIAAIKYQGGVPEGGVRSIRFPSPKPAPAPAGRPARVTVQVDKEKKVTEDVADLQALYRTANGEKVSPVLLFKKTIKLDVGKLETLAAAGGEGTDWKMTLKGGDVETFTLLPVGELDGQKVAFQGFLARVPAGYKLFPAHTVTEIRFGAEKEEPKPGTSE